MVFILLPFDHQKKKTPEISGAVLNDEFDENAAQTNCSDEREEKLFQSLPRVDRRSKSLSAAFSVWPA